MYALARAAKERSFEMNADDVPRALHGDAGYMFSKIQWLRRQERYEEAGRLMLDAPRDPARLYDLDEWWIERRVLARLSHPHIARLYDGGLGPDGEPWYAMEYIDGAPLTEWCDARKLSIAARLDLFRKACEAVDFAHRHLVIHRDIKRGNNLVAAEGHPTLLEFGIAKALTRRDA